MGGFLSLSSACCTILVLFPHAFCCYSILFLSLLFESFSEISSWFILACNFLYVIEVYVDVLFEVSLEEGGLLPVVFYISLMIFYAHFDFLLNDSYICSIITIIIFYFVYASCISMVNLFFVWLYSLEKGGRGFIATLILNFKTSVLSFFSSACYWFYMFGWFTCWYYYLVLFNVPKY